MKWIPSLGLVAVVGCGAAGPTTVHPPSQPDEPLRALATTPAAPMLDAMDRIVPALNHGAAVAELRAALTALLEQRSDDALAKLELALEHLVMAHPESIAEADAIRLAASRS